MQTAARPDYFLFIFAKNLVLTDDKFNSLVLTEGEVRDFGTFIRVPIQPLINNKTSQQGFEVFLGHLHILYIALLFILLANPKLVQKYLHFFIAMITSQ